MINWLVFSERKNEFVIVQARSFKVAYKMVNG